MSGILDFKKSDINLIGDMFQLMHENTFVPNLVQIVDGNIVCLENKDESKAICCKRLFCEYDNNSVNYSLFYLSK